MILRKICTWLNLTFLKKKKSYVVKFEILKKILVPELETFIKVHMWSLHVLIRECYRCKIWWNQIQKFFANDLKEIEKFTSKTVPIVAIIDWNKWPPVTVYASLQLYNFHLFSVTHSLRDKLASAATDCWRPIQGVFRIICNTPGISKKGFNRQRFFEGWKLAYDFMKATTFNRLRGACFDIKYL